MNRLRKSLALLLPLSTVLIIHTYAMGQSYFRKAGVEHDVRNETGSEIVFVEIEIKKSG